MRVEVTVEVVVDELMEAKKSLGFLENDLLYEKYF